MAIPNTWWARLKEWFYNSETILWARIQLFGGILWTVLSTTDMMPLLSPQYLTYWLIANGIITEYLRRRGTEVSKKTGDLIKM